MPKKVSIPYNGMMKRPTYYIRQWQVYVNAIYKCPRALAKKTQGFSRHSDVDPQLYPDLLEQMIEQATRDAIMNGKKDCFNGSDKRRLPGFRITGWGIIQFRPVTQSKIESFVPDDDYEAKKDEWNKKEQARKDEDKKYKKQRFVSEKEYHFLQKYYEFKPKEIKGMNKNERTVNKIKFSGLIDSWGTISSRKKKLREKKKTQE